MKLAQTTVIIGVLAATACLLGNLMSRLFKGSPIFPMTITAALKWQSWSEPTKVLAALACLLLGLNMFSFGRQTMARWRDKDNYSDRTGIAV